NQTFLACCLRHPEFAQGHATTAFIGKNHRELLAARGHEGLPAVLLATLLFFAASCGRQVWKRGRALTPAFPVPMRIAIGDDVHIAEILRDRDGSYEITLAEKKFSVEIEAL